MATMACTMKSEVYQVKELLYALLLQLQANKTPAVINRRYVEQALRLGREKCHYMVTVNNDVVRVTAIDESQIIKINGMG